MTILDQYPTLFADRSPLFYWIIAALVLFGLLDIVLKAICLWRSARMGKLSWFIALLVVNSLGILPLIFLVTTKKDYETFSQVALTVKGS